MISWAEGMGVLRRSLCVAPVQAALRSKDGVTLQEWDDAMTIGELRDKYDRCVHP